MASIGCEGTRGELKRIVFRDAAGKQQSLRLGKCSERAAQSALAGFERVLEAHRVGSTLHPDGIRWLENIDDRLHARVARFGLAEPRKSADVVTVGMLLDRFVNTAIVKPSTHAAYLQTTFSLRAFLGADRPLSSVTPADADNWQKALAEPTPGAGGDVDVGTPSGKADASGRALGRERGDAGGKAERRRGGPGRKAGGAALAPATRAKRTHVAKAIFRKAVRWGLIPSNTFADLKAGSQANPDRAHYVSADDARAILAACPDDEWRAIVALSRYAGLRCPSEITLLRWGDVNWDRGRLMVRSPKTAGHGEAHAVRVVPIVPELRAILQDLFDAAEVGVEAVVPRLRDPSMNLRTTFGKFIARAGVKPYPRAFHNMRASCATDWVERFPAHVVAGWLGHSPLIAATHYLQTRDVHFDLAAGVAGPKNQSERAAANPATNPATQARPSDATGDYSETDNVENLGGLEVLGIARKPLQNKGMGVTGLEPVTSSV